MASKKPSAELLDLLNQAIAREIQVSVQYMWQHVLWKGVQGYAVKDAFKMTAISEMKHAEAIAERLNYLGGIPTTKPTPIFIGTTLKQMIETDKKDEEAAIEMYKKIILVARKEGDETTEFLFNKILSDEEEISSPLSSRRIEASSRRDAANRIGTAGIPPWEPAVFFRWSRRDRMPPHGEPSSPVWNPNEKIGGTEYAGYEEDPVHGGPRRCRLRLPVPPVGVACAGCDG
jgi:bacterioferritin